MISNKHVGKFDFEVENSKVKLNFIENSRNTTPLPHESIKSDTSLKMSTV